MAKSRAYFILDQKLYGKVLRLSCVLGLWKTRQELTKTNLFHSIIDTMSE